MLKTFAIYVFLAVASAFVLSGSRVYGAVPVILAYYAFDDDSYSSLVHYGKSIDQISTDTFTLSDKGRIGGKPPTKAIRLARSQGARAYACISNYGETDFDPALAHTIVTNPVVIGSIISDLLALLKANRYDGVNIDFESLHKKDRRAFTAFVRRVSTRMRTAGYKTIVSVPAELRDDPNDSWTGAFDMASIGRCVDVVQLMTYDESGPWADPGPVAGIDWVRSAAKYAVSVVPASKLSLGMAAYGYDWDTTHRTGVSVNWHMMSTLITKCGSAPVFDKKSGSPHFQYTSGDGSHHTVWYENPKSIHQKAKLASTMKLAGVSVWALGKEDASFWKAVNAGLYSHRSYP